MASVAKHDGKQEGKGCDGEDRRIDLSVGVDAVRVYETLEACRVLVGPGGQHTCGGSPSFDQNCTCGKLDEPRK